MTLALGIDMGGTATRWVMRDGSGQIVARGAAGGASAHLFNPQTRAAFVAVLEEIARALPGHATCIHAGLTGHDDAAAPEARALLAGIFGAGIPVSVSDDVELAFHAVFRPGGGHLVVAGTGSVGLSVSAAGQVTRVGGRGMLIDDAGSGSWIALRALDALLRAQDRDGDFRAAPDLHGALSAMIGSDLTWPDIRAFVHGGDRGRIGTLAQAVSRAAARGDVMARGVMERTPVELARLAATLIARCGAGPVAFVGGVLRLDGISAGLARALPGAQLIFPEIDAAATAAQYALEKGSS